MLFTPLRNRNFRWLWTSQLVSTLGDQLRIWSVVYWVFTTSHQSPVAQSLILIAEIAPVALLGPLAGVWVDRWNRKAVMVWSDLIRAIISFSVVPAMLTGNLHLVLAMVFASSVASVFYQPASSALIPTLVDREQLMSANSLSQSTRTAITLFGPAMGTVLYQVAGPQWALSVDGLSFLVGTLCLLMVVPAVKTLEERLETGGLGFWRAFTTGLTFVWRNATVRAIFVMLSTMSLGLGFVNTLGIFLITKELALPEHFTAWGGTAQGVGMFVGAIAMGALAQRVRAYNWLTVAAAGTLGVGIALFALAPGLLIMLAGRFLLGIGATGLSVAITTLFQLSVPEDLLGRVGATLEAAPTLAMLGSAAVSGYAAQWLGIRSLLGSASVLTLMAGVFVMIGLGSLRPREQPRPVSAVYETEQGG